MKGNIQFYHGRGKLGNSVGYTLYGQQMFRAYVGKGEVKNPRTISQVTQRAKISLLTNLSVIFRNAARLGFGDEAQNRGCSAVNFFVHKNYPKVTGTTADNVNIDPTKIVVAQGSVPSVVFSSTIGTSTPGALTFTVTDVQSQVDGASDEDMIYVFVYSPDADGGILSLPATRAQGASITVRYPESWSGLEVHAYAWVNRGPFTAGARQAEVIHASSDSEYLGHVDLP